jgi:hypothetical protein
MGNSFTSAADETGQVLDRYHGWLEDSAYGLLPTARAALTSKVAAWRETASGLVTRAGEHGGELHNTANGLAGADSGVADSLSGFNDAGSI